MRTLKIYQSSGEGDAERARDFMRRNPSGNNSIRSTELLVNAASDKGLWFIEDADSHEIVAVSAIFKYGEDGEIREAGFTRVILNGYGLQRLLLALRAVHERILDPAYDLFVSSAAEGNERSVKNMTDAGYLLYKSGEDKVLDTHVEKFKNEKSKHANIDKIVEYYILKESSYKNLAVDLMHLFRSPKLSRSSRQNPGTAECVFLDFSDTALWYHRDSVEALAEGRLED